MGYINQYKMIHKKKYRPEMRGQDELVGDFWHSTLLPFAMQNNLIEDTEKTFESRLPNEFHRIFFELYLAYRLSLSGIKLQRPQNKNAPDFFFFNNNQKIWIECVCAGMGTGADMVPKIEWDVSSLNFSTYPEDEIQLRISSAITDKLKKIQDYKSKGIISNTDKYILAINIAEATQGMAFSHQSGVCFVCATVLNIGNRCIYLSNSTEELKDYGFERCSELNKKNGAQIKFDFFYDENLIGIISHDAFLWGCVINSHSQKFDYIVNPLCHDYRVLGLEPFDRVTTLVEIGGKFKIERLKSDGSK